MSTTYLPAMEYVVNIKNVLDEDTGTVGVVHVVVESAAAGLALIRDIVREEDADIADFDLVVAANGWECVGHGDGLLCTAAPRLN